MRIAASFSVLLGGILAALLFRHDNDVRGTAPSVTEGSDRLVLRKQIEPRSAGTQVDGHHARRAVSPFAADAASKAAGRRATILTPMDSGQTPPALARDYPGAGVQGGSAWGTPIQLPPPTRPEDATRTHEIVDGDTLEALAQRYFGSANRSLELYEANRDVLSSPNLLPIGEKLKIPPLRPRAPPSFDSMPNRPLVPIFLRRGGGDERREDRVED